MVKKDRIVDDFTTHVLQQPTIEELQLAALNSQRKLVSKSYVRTQVGEKAIIVKSLLDTGNLLGSSISLEFAQKCGLQFTPLEQAVKAGTAAKSSKLNIVGRLPKLAVRFEGIPKTFYEDFYVIKNLSYPVNIGLSFMTKHGMSLQLKPPASLIYVTHKAKLVSSQAPTFNSNSRDGVFAELSTTMEAIKPCGKESYVAITSMDHPVSERKWQECAQVLPVTPRQEVKLKRQHVHYVKCHVNANKGDKISLIAPPQKRRRDKLSRLGLKINNQITTVNDQGCIQVEINVMEDDEMKTDECVIPAKTVLAEARRLILNKDHRDEKLKQFDQSLLEEEITAEGVFQITGKKQSKDDKIVLSAKPTKLCNREQKQARRQFIIDELKLQENKELIDRPDVKEEVINIFLDNWQAVARHQYDYGSYQGEPFCIKLIPGSKPVRHKVKPLNPDQLASLKEQVQAWLKTDVVQRSNSPWGARLVPVAKPHGGGTRWACDFRSLNRCTIEDSYPLQSIADNLDRMRGGVFFSSLDSRGAFHVLKVKPEDQHKTSFLTPFGSYSFKRLPFGVKNGPASFCRLMNQLLESLDEEARENTLAYLDDVVTKSSTLEEHCVTLRKVLEAHCKFGLKLNLTKCQLFKRQIKYLGFIINEHGIELDPEYLKRIHEWPLPRTGKELASFLGICGFYRRSIKHYATLTADLEAIKRKKILEWTPSLKQAFEDLKTAFCGPTNRAYPDFEASRKGSPFILTTDWSTKAISAVLSQEQNGVERMIAACGRKCSGPESRYDSMKGEMCALIHGLNKFDHILSYSKFIWRTDSKDLLSWATAKRTSNIFARWHELLSRYNFTEEHISGVSNVVADALSRSSHLPEPTTAELEKEGEVDLSVHAMRKEQQQQRLIDPVDILKSQDEDEIISTVKEWVKNQQPPPLKILAGEHPHLSNYRHLFSRLKINDQGLLVMTYKDDMKESEEIERVCVPTNLEEQLLTLSHNHILASHRGVNETYHKLSTRFYWPNMSSAIEAWVESCGRCLQKRKPPAVRREVHVPHKSNDFNSLLFVDLVGPLDRTPAGFRYILTIQDHHTKFSECAPLKSKSADEVAKAFVNTWITRHGVPVKVQSDQGTEFTNHIFTKLMENMGIEKTTTPAYSPNSNLIERMHKTLGQALRAISAGPKDWALKLPAALFAINTSKHRYTGVSPFFALHLRKPRLPIDVMIKKPPTSEEEEPKSLYQMFNIYRQVREWLIKRQNLSADLTSRAYTGVLKKKFAVNDIVYYYRPAKIQGYSYKLQFNWTGPYVITDVKPPLLYTIRKIDKNNKPYGDKIVVKCDKLAHYRRSDTDEITGENLFTTPAERGNVRLPRYGETPRGRPPSKPPAESTGLPESPAEPENIVFDPVSEETHFSTESNDHHSPVQEDYELPKSAAEFKPPFQPGKRLLRSAAARLDISDSSRHFNFELPTRGKFRKRYT